ncbi:MAG: dihydroorotate dehydrogenase [Bacteroidota bacterium]
MARTAFSLRSVVFRNRVLVASGTFGYGDECTGEDGGSGPGGLITKSLSLKPRSGNPPVRIVETPSGMLNSIGLANIGVEEFVRGRLPRLRALDIPVIANIAGSSLDEYARVLDILEGEEGVAGYEINVSCPNVREGGLLFGTRCDMTAALTRGLRPRTSRPLVLKLTPNVTHVSEFARAVEAEGADAVSLINTLIGMAVDVRTRRPVLSSVTGGLSGPAIRPVALAKVWEAARAVRIPVIGIGGIMTPTDALEFLIAGATAIQVGTANFVDPSAAGRIARGIEAFCDEQGIPDAGDLVGSLRAEPGASIVESWL